MENRGYGKPVKMFCGQDLYYAILMRRDFHQEQNGNRNTISGVLDYRQRTGFLSGSNCAIWNSRKHGGDGNLRAMQKRAVERGIGWLKRFLSEEGKGGIKEGLAHNIAPDGKYTVLDGVRTDCTGESAGRI